MRPESSGGPPCILTDFVDVDSEKWRAYSGRTSGPMKLLYARERRALLAWDERLCTASDAGLFVTQAEVELIERCLEAKALK